MDEETGPGTEALTCKERRCFYKSHSFSILRFFKGLFRKVERLFLHLFGRINRNSKQILFKVQQKEICLF